MRVTQLTWQGLGRYNVRHVLVFSGVATGTDGGNLGIARGADFGRTALRLARECAFGLVYPQCFAIITLLGALR